MSAEIVLFALGGATLVVVLVMDTLGALGVFGVLRFTACPRCDRWTVHGLGATELSCHRCRRRDVQMIRAHRLHWPNFGS
jgi:hypothetical protein